MNPLRQLIDLVYPPRCAICREFLFDDPSKDERPPLSLCGTCFSDFREINSPLCPICSTPFVAGFEEDHLCEDCLRKRPFFDALVAPFHHSGALMEAIHQFKYSGKTALAKSLGPLLAQFAQKHIRSSNNLLALPVPLHPRRLRERGFNQSLLLARHVSKRLDTKLDFLSLRRIKYTLPQTSLKKKDRRKNVRRAFQVVSPQAVKGKAVLLVDDVATTGNTLNECARVLKQNGAKNVLCLVLARAGGTV